MGSLTECFDIAKVNFLGSCFDINYLVSWAYDTIYFGFVSILALSNSLCRNGKKVEEKKVIAHQN